MDRKTYLEELLNRASEEYYNGGLPILSDMEYDKLLEELRELEKETGHSENSPVDKVGASGGKVPHEVPALSLAKVKYANRESLLDWIGFREGVLSWKLDGSTLVLTYDNGELVSAVTRGDGYFGTDVTKNARHFKGIPTKIEYKDHLVVRGEALMTYKEFERINAEGDDVYENPRNLATATIQMLDKNEAKKREIRFYAFKLVTPKKRTETISFEFLRDLGFEPVEYWPVHKDILLKSIDFLNKKVSENEYPTDGLVLSYDNTQYADSLGSTEHHPRGSIALKWTDETKETIIRDIEWSVGRTGAITPVAIFDPVRLGVGSTVTRASLHNLSLMAKIPLTDDSDTAPIQIGSKAQVYLANLIIPQVASIDNTEAKGLIMPPENCPICNERTEIKTNGPVTTLHCSNEKCPARQIGNLLNTFSQDGLFVRGMGESQIEDLLQFGLVNDKPVSFYELEESQRFEKTPEILALLKKDGWGEKKWNNLMIAIRESRETTLQKFLYSLNIPLLGNDLSKKLAKLFRNIDEFVEFVKFPSMDYLTKEEGIGTEKAKNIVHWCENVDFSFFELVGVLNIQGEAAGSDELKGLTFVITGNVEDYKNRNEFKESVERRGGKVSGSVSSNTSFLVNNDVASNSSKNKKAKELGVEIISEKEFIERFGK